LSILKNLKTATEGVKALQDAKSNPLGVTLKALREGKGLSLEEIAKKTKIAITTLLDIEGNKVKPTTDIITKLAKQYGVNVNSLLGKK